MTDFSNTMIETPNTAMAFDPSDVPIVQPEPGYSGTPATAAPDLPDTAPLNYEGPIGVTGVIDNVTTGCSYSPLSHSNLRAIDDIVVPGSVGKYPLKMTRYYNSRSWHWDYFRGLSPGWSHQYSWLLWTTGYKVISPQGNVSDFYCGQPVGVSEGWDDGNQDSHPNGGIWRLADGGRVHFSGGRGDYIEDPYGLRTTIAYDGNGRVWKVTEPGGRYLQFTYGTTNAYIDPTWGNQLLKKVEAWDGQGNLIESVTYTYTNVDSGGVNPSTGQHVIRRMLTGAAYDDNTSASYTYRTDNVPDHPLTPPYTIKFAPLLEKCNDKRYSGPMRQIFYEYQEGGPHGAILKERHLNANGALVSKIEPDLPVNPTVGWMPNQFTETRGDDPIRTFTYTPFQVHLQNPDPEEYDPCLDVHSNNPPQQMLTDYTDYYTPGSQGHTTHIGYDTTTWYITSVRDANGNTTSYERGNPPSQDGIGEIKKIIHPGGSYIQYTYEPENNALDGHYIRSIRDENAHTTTITRDGDHRITGIDYPADANTPASYEEFSDFDNFGHPRIHRLRNGAYESFVYSGRGLLIDKYSPKFNSVPGGNDPHVHYDYYTAADGKLGWIDRVKKVTMPANWLGHVASETYEYDRNSSSQPCAGRGLVTKITHADGWFQSFRYDQWGNKVSEWNELAERTDYVYDSYNRVTSVTKANETTSYRYQPTNGNGTSPYLHTTNNPDRITSPTGIVTSNVYDQNFRKTSSTAASGTSQAATTWFHYDAVGNQDCVTDPRGSGPCSSPLSPWPYTTRTEYDTRNRKWHVWNAQDHRTTFTYDSASNVRYIERPDLSTEERLYDALNRVIRDIMPYKGGNSPVNLITRFEYNPSGTIHKVTLTNDDSADPNPDHWTTFDYDASDRRKLMTYQNNHTQQWVYDNAGNLSWRISAGGQTLFFGYDNRNRKYLEGWCGQSECAEWRYFTFDAASQLKRIQNGTGAWFANMISDVHRNYSHAGRVILDQQAVTGLGTKNVNYEYDVSYGGSDEKPTRVYVTPAPNPSYDYDFRYDALGRFEKILPHGGNTAQFQYYYDPASNETQRRNWLSGGNYVDQSYYPDSLNRPTTADLLRNGSRFARESYDYNAMGRLHTVTRLDNRQDQFGYYLDGELFWAMYGVSGISAPDPSETPPAEDPDKEKTPEDFLSLSGWDPNLALTADRTVTYVYDKAGNRTWVADTGPNGNNTYTPNNINQYESMGPPNNQFTVWNGAEHEISAYRGITYNYRKDQQLVHVESSGNGDTYDLAYDALGRCVKRTVNGVAKYYIYDGDRPILEYGAIGNLRGKNLYGKGIDEILMRWDATVHDPNLRTFYYQQDHEGSVTHLTKPDGTVFERYRYDVFGTPTIYDVDWNLRTASAVSNRFLFTGREYNANFAFYEYRARAYHPGLGRFMSEDPKGVDAGDYNLFRYCGNDPVDKTDPMGLLPVVLDSETEALTQTASQRNYQAQRGEFFLWQFFRQPMERAEYGTTVLQDQQTAQRSLSKTYTDGLRGKLAVQDTAGKTSLVYTHIHPNESISSVTNSHLSENDVALAIATGRTVQVSTPRGVQDQYRPSDKATWLERYWDGGIIERRDSSGKWMPLRGPGDTRVSRDLIERMATSHARELKTENRYFIGPQGLFNGRPY